MASTIITDHYKKSEVQLAKFCKAMSHPARLAIIRLLFNKDYCFVGEMVNQLPLSQSSVSQHLKELKNANLVIAEDIPPRIKYSFNYQIFEEAKQLNTDYFNKFIYEKASI